MCVLLYVHILSTLMIAGICFARNFFFFFFFFFFIYNITVVSVFFRSLLISKKDITIDASPR